MPILRIKERICTDETKVMTYLFDNLKDFKRLVDTEDDNINGLFRFGFFDPKYGLQELVNIIMHADNKGKMSHSIESPKKL